MDRRHGPKRALTQAVACSERLKGFLRRVNGSSLRSYIEAEAELLNLHQLKLGSNLKKFFSSTNPVESLNSLLEEDMRRVKRWRDSTHFRRWIATMALKNETRMRRVRGFNGMEALKVRIQQLCRPEKIDDAIVAASIQRTTQLRVSTKLRDIPFYLDESIN
jgi:hypothetical protein